MVRRQQAHRGRERVFESQSACERESKTVGIRRGSQEASVGGHICIDIRVGARCLYMPAVIPDADSRSHSAFNNSYLKALQLRQHLRKDFDAVLRSSHPLRPLPDSSSAHHKHLVKNGVDFLLHLTSVQTAPLLSPDPPPSSPQTHPEAVAEQGQEDTANRKDNEQDAEDQGSESGSNYTQDLLTVPASLGGLPSLSIPAGLGQDGWPVGVSLTGQWGSEANLLEVARIGMESMDRGL